MFHVKVGWHKGSYCKLLVEIHGSIFEKSLNENLNLAWAPHNTSFGKSLNEGIKPWKSKGQFVLR